MDKNTSLTFYIIIFIIASCLSFFCSLLETSYILSDESRIRTYRQKYPKSERKCKTLLILKNKHWALSAIIFANNFLGVIITFIGTTVAIDYLNVNNTQSIFVVISLAFYIVIFLELIPKRIGFYAPTKVAIFISYPAYIWVYLFFPIAYLLSAPFKKTKEGKGMYSRNEIIDILGIAKHSNVITEKEHSLIVSAFYFKDRQVKDVMIDIQEVKSVFYSDSFSKINKTFNTTNFNSLPVKTKNKEIIGVIHIEKFHELESAENFHIDNIMSKKFYVVANWSLSNCLDQFNIANKHFAFVVESMQTQNIIGIVTTKDLISPIVGKYTSIKNKKKEIYAFNHSEYNVKPTILAIKALAYIYQINDREIFDVNVDKNISFRDWISKISNNSFKFEEGENIEYKDLNITYFVSSNNHPYFIVRQIKNLNDSI